MRERTLRTGTTVVTVTFKNIKTAKSTAKKYRCVVKAALEQKPEEPATTAGKITAIKQTSATKLAAEFSADMTGIKYTDLKIVRDKTGAVVTVKSATVDKDNNTKVTIETYEALTDGEAYTVTYTAADEAKTESSATFTATAGVVASIALNTTSIPASTPTEIKYQLLDANGVLLEEKGIGKSKSDRVDISIENFSGYQNDNEVTLYNVGDKATLKVVYHTWKYNNTDGTEEGKVEGTFEIIAVDQSSVIATYDYTVVKDKTDVVDFKRDTLKTQIALEDDANKDPAVKFSFRKADGTDITKNLDYTVSSGNENILLASGSVSDIDNGAKITPVAAGSTYLMIKNASGTVVKTLPITVVAKRALSTMTVDKSNVTVAQTSGTEGTQYITIAVMDQYSDAYDKFGWNTPELKSSNDDSGITITPALSASETNKLGLKVQTNGAKSGTYAYTIDLIDTSKTTDNIKKVSFSITVSKMLEANYNYALVMMNGANDAVLSKVDTTVTPVSNGLDTLVPVIVAKNNGSIVGNANVGDLDVVVSVGAVTLKKNGTEVKNSASNTVVVNQTSSDIDYISVNVNTGLGTKASPIVKHLEPGTYTLSLVAKLNIGGKDKLQNMSTSFVVEDSQKVFEAAVKQTSVAKTDGSSLKDVFENENYVKFSYASQTIDRATPYDYYYDSAKQTKVNSTSISVEKVYMNVELPGTGNKYVLVSAPVNRTFTFGGSVSSADVIAKDTKAFVASVATTGNTLKPTLTTAELKNAVNTACGILDKYNQLTATEQADAKADKDKAVDLGLQAVVKLAAGVTTSTPDDEIIDILFLTGANEYDLADIATIKQAMAGSGFQGAVTSTGTAITACEALVDQVNEDQAAVIATYNNVISAINTISGASLSSKYEATYAIVSSCSVTTSASAINAAAVSSSTITYNIITSAGISSPKVGFTHTAANAAVGDTIEVTYEIFVESPAASSYNNLKFANESGTIKVKYECTKAGALDTAEWKIVKIS